ncbi:MAG TPA: hypothetical protein VMV69_11830 [Pirellulales bacterium]|nr:hypothetical protein [Pirellulales bacterium]
MDEFQFRFCCLAATSAALFGLLAVWAALGRAHWFVRVVSVLAALALLLPVPAFDVLLVFFFQSPIVIGPLLVVRVFRSRAATIGESAPPIRPRFSLADLFLATLVIAAMCGVGINLPQEIRQASGDYIVIGSGLGVATLAAVWVAIAQRPWWLRLAVLGIAAPAAGVPAAIGTDFFRMGFDLIGWAWCGATAGLGMLVAVFLWLGWKAGCVSVQSGTAEPSQGSSTAQRRHLRRGLARIDLAALSLVMLLLPGVAYYQMLTPAPIPYVTLPSPNGYDELIRVGRLLQDQIVPDANAANQAQLEAFVTQHAALLGAVRAALDHPSQARVDYGPFTPVFDDLGTIRQLGKAMYAEAKLAELAGGTDSAVVAYSNNIRLGQAVSHGGLLLHWLVGLAIHGAGLQELCRIRNSLSPEQCRELIATLQYLEAAAEPIGDVVARDAVSEGWLPRVLFLDALGSATMYDQLSDRTIAASRLLVCDLALRIYKADHGRVPQRLAELVPRYLSVVPCDPFSGELPVYRRADESYILYSVGADGVDNGGIAGSSNSPPGMEAGSDLVLPAARQNPPDGAP